MAGEKAPYFRFYAFDWDSDFTQRKLDCAGAGIYTRLMVCQWIEGGLDDDPLGLQRYTGATDEEWARTWPVLEAKFPVSIDGKRRNERLEHERREMERASQLQFLRGSKGGRPRKENPDETREEPGNNPEETRGLAAGSPDETRIEPNQEPRTKNQEPDPEGEGSAPADEADPHAFAGELIAEINRHLPGHELKPHPAISFAVANLLLAGHPKGLAFANGRYPLAREDLVDAVHGWIIAEAKDPWHREQREKGKPFAFSRLVLDPDRLAEYAERGRYRWADWLAPPDAPGTGLPPPDPEILARHRKREADDLAKRKAERDAKPPEGLSARQTREWYEKRGRKL